MLKTLSWSGPWYTLLYLGGNISSDADKVITREVFEVLHESFETVNPSPSYLKS